jgi:hypothetical protein
MFTDYLINIDYLIKKKSKKVFFRGFWVQQGWISRFLLYLLISTCFVANKKPQFLKNRHFWPKVLIFWPKTHFLELLCPNNVMNAYDERILGQIFTLIQNPGSKNMFWLLKKVISFKTNSVFFANSSSEVGILKFSTKNNDKIAYEIVRFICFSVVCICFEYCFDTFFNILLS